MLESVEAVSNLVVIFKTHYSVDTNRICLTGLSSGGIGSWNLPPQINLNPFSFVVPHSAFRGQTPMEMYFGTGDHWPDELARRSKAAQAKRVEQNRAMSCGACAPGVANDVARNAI